jgi:acetylglutamate kinase
MTCTRIHYSNQTDFSYSKKKISVLKFGGDILENEEKLFSILKNALKNKEKFGNLVIVHGWGKDLDKLQKESGIEIVKKDGLRFTDEKTLGLCSVLKEKYSSLISNLLKKLEFELATFQGENTIFLNAKQKQGLGLVGEMDETNFQKQDFLGFINKVFNQNQIPIFSPLIKSSSSKALLNINADSLAGFLAGTLQADLYFFSEVGGVLDEQKNLISDLSFEQCQKLLELGVISGGMVPKLQEAYKTVQNGAKNVYILNNLDYSFLEREKTANKGILE